MRRRRRTVPRATAVSRAHQSRDRRQAGQPGAAESPAAVAEESGCGSVAHPARRCERARDSTAAKQSRPPATRARRRKSSCRSGSSVSTVRYTAARNANRTQREQAERQRERREPGRDVAGHEIVRCAEPPTRPGRDRPDRHPQQHRRHEARDREEPAPAALRHVVMAVVAAERERRSAQHDADQHEGERDVERDGQLGERAGETGEEQHDGEDQPDMVRLPHRADRVGDRASRCRSRRARRRADPRRRRRSPRPARST